MPGLSGRLSTVVKAKISRLLGEFTGDGLIPG